MRLSVLLPSYNYAQYLNQSIESILQQSFRDFELLIIDDGSTDDSPAIIERYAACDLRIRWLRHPVNQGLFPTVEELLQEARGEYIQFTSADDYYLPGFLEKSMNFFDRHPEMSLCCSDICYETGQEKKTVKLLPLREAQFMHPSQLINLFRTTSFWIPGANCVIKKSVLQDYAGFVPALENIADWYCYHKIALIEGVGYIPETLTTMRVHAQTYTSQVKKNKKRKIATYWCLLNHLSKNESPEICKRFKEASLLTFVFEQLFWKLIWDPRYWSYFPWLVIKTKKLRLRTVVMQMLARKSIQPNQLEI